MIYDLIKATAVYTVVTLNTVALLLSANTPRGIRSFEIVMTAISFIMVYLNVRRKDNS